MKNLVEDNLKAAAQVATRCIITGTVKKIEETFSVVHDEKSDEVETPMRIMMEGAFADMIEQGRLNTLLLRNVYRMTMFNFFMDTVIPWAATSITIITPIAAFVEKHVDGLVDSIRFQKTLEPQLTQPGMMQAVLPRSIAMSPKFEPCIPTLRKRSASNEMHGEKSKMSKW